MKPLSKPSNTPWLGQVPEHWEVKRLKHGLSLSNDRLEVDQEVSLPYVGMENIESWTGRLLPLDEEFIPTGTSNRFDQGQVLFGKLRPYLAKATIADRSGGCSTELMVFEPKEFDNRFLLYLILSDGFIKLVDSSTQGSKMPRADWEFIGNIEVAYPPLPEQRAIATYLDERTARIDGLVARQRRLVQLLKEKRQALITRAVTRGLDPKTKVKDSGVPWLGEVPVGWEVKRIRYCFRFQSGGTPSTTKEEYWDGDLPWVSAKDMKVLDLHDTQDHIAEFALAESAANKVPEGTLLVLTRSGILQHTLPVSVNTREVAINQDVKGCIPAIDLNALFAAYWIHGLQDQLLNIWRQEGATVESLDFETVKDTLIPIPERHEQDRIVDYIRRRTLQIDTLITKVEQAVERLQEYRTALISAAVTGKVRVPQ